VDYADVDIKFWIIWYYTYMGYFIFK